MTGRLRWILIALPPLATAQLVTTMWPEPTAAALEADAGGPDPGRPTPGDAHAPLAPRPRTPASMGSVTLAARISPVASSSALPATVDPSLESKMDAQPPRLPAEAQPELPTAPDPSAPAVAAGREIFSGPRDAPRVALTFDDGPSEGNTERILDVLAAKGVQATFFVLGPRVEKRPALVVRAHEEGHEIANHGWSHTSLRSLWASQIEEEIDHTGDLVQAAIGHRPALFRPPFGRYPPSSIPLVRERDMNLVLWSVDAEDWGSDIDPDQTVERVLEQAHAGSIILLHDREPTTAQALPRIIDGLRAQGLEPGPVSWVTGVSAYVEPSGDRSDAEPSDPPPVIPADRDRRASPD